MRLVEELERDVVDRPVVDVVERLANGVFGIPTRRLQVFVALRVQPRHLFSFCELKSENNGLNEAEGSKEAKRRHYARTSS